MSELCSCPSKAATPSGRYFLQSGVRKVTGIPVFRPKQPSSLDHMEIRLQYPGAEEIDIDHMYLAEPRFIYAVRDFNGTALQATTGPHGRIWKR